MRWDYFSILSTTNIILMWIFCEIKNILMIKIIIIKFDFYSIFYIPAFKLNFKNSWNFQKFTQNEQILETHLLKGHWKIPRGKIGLQSLRGFTKLTYHIKTKGSPSVPNLAAEATNM